MKVLISAYACEPDRGSEQGVGWHWGLAAAEQHDVVIVTRANNRRAIEAATADRDPRVTPHFEYLDLPWAQRFKRGNQGIRLYYWQWQRALTGVARRLHEVHHFDVMHHLTLAADSLPVGLTELADDVPLVWGPVGGATGTPWRLARWLTFQGVAKDAARTVVSGMGRATAGRRAAEAAAVTLSLNSDVAAALRRRGVDAFIEQNAVVEPHLAPSSHASDPPVAVFAGRLEGWKGLLLAIDAISRTARWRLHVYGEGPDRNAAERLVRRRALHDRVVFHGRVTLGEVHRALSTGSALLFPSMHDSSPFVVAEAMAMGCPVVCLDRGGPADMVDGRSGVVVPAGASDLPAALARALEVVEPQPYDGRWAPGRLPELLSHYYELAVRRQ